MDDVEFYQALRSLYKGARERDNPFGVCAKTPANDLLDLSEVDFTGRYAAELAECRALWAHVVDLKSQPLVVSRNLFEAHYSNKIEGIDCEAQDEALSQLPAWLVSRGDNVLSSASLNAASKRLGVYKPGVRVRHKDSVTRIGSSVRIHYTPPNTGVVIRRLLDGLAQFDLHSTLPEIAKLALYHYQFESIHPLYDGNGRLGRALITRQMVRLGFASSTICLSRHLSGHRSSYYEALNAPRFKHDFSPILTLFINAVESELNYWAREKKRGMEY